MMLFYHKGTYNGRAAKKGEFSGRVIFQDVDGKWKKATDYTLFIPTIEVLPKVPAGMTGGPDDLDAVFDDYDTHND